MQSLIVSVLITVVSAILIFGGQFLSNSQLDDKIAEKIASTLHSEDQVDVTIVKKVHNGYGVCGRYHLKTGEERAFFFNKVNDHLALEKSSKRYRVNCTKG